MNQQFPRLAIAFGVVAVAFVAARYFLIPPTFGDLGHYRAAAVDSIAVRPVKYAGRVECADCHEDVVDESRVGNHRGVSCEVCHGPAFAHADGGGETKTPNVIVARQFCPVCHAYNASRPTGFPQIDPVEHNPLKACTNCHKPHAPVPPRVPGECKACHRQIAQAKSVSKHARVECTGCHTVPQQHKVDPRAVLVGKPTDATACTRCHAQSDKARQQEATQIKLDTHYPRNLCWDCHYSHNPKASS